MNKHTGPLVQAPIDAEIEVKAAPSLERRRLRTYIGMLIADAVIIHLSFALAAFAYEGIWWHPRAMLAAQALLPLYFTIALYNATYGAQALRDNAFAIRQALTALALSAALLSFLAFYTKSTADFSRVSVSLGLILFAIMLVFSRRIMMRLIDHFWSGRTRNFLVIEDGGPSFTLETAQFVSASDYALNPETHDPHMLDRLGKLLRNQDKVIVSCPRERTHSWAYWLKSAGIPGEIVSEPAHDLGVLGVHRYEDQGRTSLVVSSGPLGMRGRIAKRAFDVIVSIMGLVLLAPVFLLIAVRIKVEDGGPVFFIQRRLGRSNRFFNMLKFRSMREERRDPNGDRSTMRADERVTKVGQYIRRTSLDELPQLINVLRGDMSIVGPRPHALGSRANDKLFWEVDGQYWQRHSLKPGLTGLAQVRGHRGATEQEKDLTDRLQSDLEYIAGWSLIGDMRIIYDTVWVLRHDNAY